MSECLMKCKVLVDHGLCDLCLKCTSYCPCKAISFDGEKLFVDQDKCICCYGCVISCAKGALSITWFCSEK